MKNVKLFSHTDLDGYGCNILIKGLYNDYHIDKYENDNLNYDNINEKVKDFILNKEYVSFDTVFITDISVNEEVAELIDKLYKYNVINIILLDHHKTALWLNKYDWAIVSETMELENGEIEKTSGTELLYNYLCNKFKINLCSLKDFVTQVKRYDTWLWKDKYNDIIPKQLNNLFYILGSDRFSRLLLDCPKVDYFIDSNKLLLELEQDKIQRYIEGKNKNIVQNEINGYKVGIIFAEQYISELGNKLSEMNPEYDLIAIIGSNTVSYRTTREDIDCSKFASIYGGGGHPKASGSKIDDHIKHKIIDTLFDI